MSYNSLQPLGDNYIATTFWALATLHGAVVLSRDN
jgi:hypothetical protein